MISRIAGQLSADRSDDRFYTHKLVISHSTAEWVGGEDVMPIGLKHLWTGWNGERHAKATADVSGDIPVFAAMLLMSSTVSCSKSFISLLITYLLNYCTNTRFTRFSPILWHPCLGTQRLGWTAISPLDSFNSISKIISTKARIFPSKWPILTRSSSDPVVSNRISAAKISIFLSLSHCLYL